MEGSVVSFLRVEWKMSDTGSAASSSFTQEYFIPYIHDFINYHQYGLLLT